jgi:NAD(P)-dependent dehydrogenase (short-subunit alcohol dehydrogenase family)
MSMTSASYLILGSTGGIGRVLCERLAKRGASLLLGGRDPERLMDLAARTGGEAFPGDVREASTVEQAVARAVERYGRLDGAVNLVGSMLLEPAHLTRPDEWDEVVATNLGTASHLVRVVAKALREHGGSIVLVSSAVARAGMAGHGAIASAKAGVEVLARSAAASYAARNVRVNCVAPGLVTPLTERLTAAPSPLAASEALHLLGRIVDPGDVASAIAWLFDPANAWVTGRVIGVDGGLAALRGPARAVDTQSLT